MLLHKVAVGALGLGRHKVVVGPLRLRPLAPVPDLPNPRLDAVLRPAEPSHSRVDAVAVDGLLVGADVDDQGPQNLHKLLAQLLQGLWDVIGLGHPVSAVALLAGRDFKPWPPAVCQSRPRLQRAAILADAPGS